MVKLKLIRAPICLGAFINLDAYDFNVLINVDESNVILLLLEDMSITFLPFVVSSTETVEALSIPLEHPRGYSCYVIIIT